MKGNGIVCIVLVVVKDYWNEEAKGYPCWIVFAGRKHICVDKESLKLAIADLLADLFVAKTLFKPGVDLVVAANVIY